MIHRVPGLRVNSSSNHCRKTKAMTPSNQIYPFSTIEAMEQYSTKALNQGYIVPSTSVTIARIFIVKWGECLKPCTNLLNQTSVNCVSHCLWSLPHWSNSKRLKYLAVIQVCHLLHWLYFHILHSQGNPCIPHQKGFSTASRKPTVHQKLHLVAFFSRN